MALFSNDAEGNKKTLYLERAEPSLREAWGEVEDFSADPKIQSIVQSALEKAAVPPKNKKAFLKEALPFLEGCLGKVHQIGIFHLEPCLGKILMETKAENINGIDFIRTLQEGVQKQAAQALT